MGLVGTIYMLSISTQSGQIIPLLIYGVSLILLYTMSALYHAASTAKAKHVLQAFDHSTIYLLIAGTYTPFALLALNATIGYVVLCLIWASAVAGIILNILSVERFKKASLILYIASGWAAVIAIKPMLQNVPMNGLVLLLIGGLLYTGGIVFYKMKSHKYFHGIWHLFVLAGSVTHFFSILTLI